MQTALFRAQMLSVVSVEEGADVQNVADDVAISWPQVLILHHFSNFSKSRENLILSTESTMEKSAQVYVWKHKERLEDYLLSGGKGGKPHNSLQNFLTMSRRALEQPACSNCSPPHLKY